MFQSWFRKFTEPPPTLRTPVYMYGFQQNQKTNLENDSVLGTHLFRVWAFERHPLFGAMANLLPMSEVR